ncbi:OsmC family protein [Ruania zhangjianzhongii]|uniref:OsmC family protein n=1 Tax=Ruania zhangjianzhongii TaxID=2603206 RepID=UPI0011CAD5B6|nr:OsmC family protein [Ruania zhangjianzhongii]
MQESPDQVSIERSSTRRYVARNDRGAEVQIGGEETDAVFTPGELLAIALGACNVMSADIPLSRRLGEDFTASATVHRTKLAEENRYTAAAVELVLGPEAAGRLAELEPVITRAVERGCTVGRTLEAGLTDSLTIRADPEG